MSKARVQSQQKSLKNSKFHFIGIGGIGMCGLAELLHGMGAQVTGSDLSVNANVERLLSLGISVAQGHRAENVGDAEVVVYSSAVHFENLEIQFAKEKKIPLIQRAEALAEMMRLKRGLAIAGSHGKTTTTSMIGSLLHHANMNPTIFVGGRLNLIGSTAQLGAGDWIVAEADESDGSFHLLHPEVSIITNIDTDHLDHYKSFENLHKAFYEFALQTPFYGLVIACGDDPLLRKTFKEFPKRIIFYGFDQANDYILAGEKGRYNLSGDALSGFDFPKDKAFHFSINTPGKHNALNATASILAAAFVGAEHSSIQQSLQIFGGVDRRFHFKGEHGDIQVYDDYGHHPTEIKATLQAFREKFESEKLVVYFQPHRYSRTQLCWNEFANCFAQADVVYLGDIYAAGEKPLPGINSENLLKTINHQNKHLWSAAGQNSSDLAMKLKARDVFVTLGAGDGWKLGLAVLEDLKRGRP